MAGEEIRYAAIRQRDDLGGGGQAAVDVREAAESILQFVLGFLVMLAGCKLIVGAEFAAL